MTAAEHFCKTLAKAGIQHFLGPAFAGTSGRVYRGGAAGTSGRVYRGGGAGGALAFLFFGFFFGLTGFAGAGGSGMPSIMVSRPAAKR